MNKIVLNRQGIRELLNSAEVQNEVSKIANEVVGRCGLGFVATSPKTTPRRTSVLVKAETYEAKVKNSKENTLVKAINGGSL